MDKLSHLFIGIPLGAIGIFLIVWIIMQKNKNATNTPRSHIAAYVFCYVILSSVLVGSIISPIFSGIHYMQGQERAKEIFIAVSYDTGNREMANYSISEMWSHYNPEYRPESYESWGYVPDNSALIEVARQEDYELGRMLKKEGFTEHGRRGSYYFEYSSFADYYLNIVTNNFVLYLCIGVFIVLIICTQVSETRMRRKTIAFEGDTVLCMYKDQVTAQFRFVDVAEVTFFGKTGIVLKVNNNAHKFHYIGNREEIRDTIMQQRSAVSTQIPVAPTAQPAPSNNVDEMYQYKKLLDDGVITQDEFDAKKKQLLGL